MIKSCVSFPLQIFSIVVFGSIINEGYVNHGSERLYCVFNKNNDACNYGTTIGLIAFLACIFFIILDVKFQQISSIKDRKKAVMLDIGFSGKQWERVQTDSDSLWLHVIFKLWNIHGVWQRFHRSTVLPSDIVTFICDFVFLCKHGAV